MNRLLFAVLVFSIAGAANAKAKAFEAQCGGMLFRVEAINKGHPLENEYRLSVKDAGKEKALFVANEGGWFHAKCIKAKSGKELLLFQSYCGGSGCAEDRYGIVDPGSLQLILTPGTENVGNSKQATKIIGYEVPYLPREKDAFCCE